MIIDFKIPAENLRDILIRDFKDEADLDLAIKDIAKIIDAIFIDYKIFRNVMNSATIGTMIAAYLNPQLKSSVHSVGFYNKYEERLFSSINDGDNLILTRGVAICLLKCNINGAESKNSADKLFNFIIDKEMIPDDPIREGPCSDFV